MKKFFEQPELQVQSFAVEDQLLVSGGNWLEGVGFGADETNRYGISGAPISSR